MSEKDITPKKFTNELISESSPYLLQHAHNPVNWYAWNDEALEKAKNENKPIFLSIGYTACHWCHVMEEESFENRDIAKILNEHFISIKVDREQRPDLDQIYMAATTALSGSGGWPMSVFMTPDLKPFFAGTYFPPDDKYGRPGFSRVINEIAVTWREDPGRIEDYSASLTERLQEAYHTTENPVEVTDYTIEQTTRSLLGNYDPTNGGFGAAPKFPHPVDLSFLLKVYSRDKDQKILEAVKKSLDKMARGGIYDQIGGGFHRYSVDSRWLVPHFEKMLYDNALLAVTYSEAYQLTGDELYKRIVTETLDFVLREMTHENGGFYSSLDADSEGEEGKYYVWTKDEVDQLLGDNSRHFEAYYNITKNGNFENNTNIPNIDNSSEEYFERTDMDWSDFEKIIADGKKKLFEVRSKRERPLTDDKILASWNGLMISGMSYGYMITGDSKYREAASKAARFLKDSLFVDGKLRHSYRDAKLSSGLFLEDYAYFIQGLIDLYQVDYDFSWINWAAELAEDASKMFADEKGNLYLSPAEQTDHYMRPKEINDGATPAPGSILIQSLLRLSDITGKKEFYENAEKYLGAISNNIIRLPQAMVSAVSAFDYMNSERVELVVIGADNRDAFISQYYRRYFPYGLLIVSESGNEDIPLLADRSSEDGVRAFLCRNFSCNLPAETPADLELQLSEIK